MGLWKPKELTEGSREVPPPKEAGEGWRGASAFLGHYLMKHMLASECLGIVGSARIWISVLGPKDPRLAS